MFPAERSFTASSIVVDFLRVPANTTVLSRFPANRFLFLISLFFFQTSSASYPPTCFNLSSLARSSLSRLVFTSKFSEQVPVPDGIVRLLIVIVRMPL